jgi:3',5'-cyclic AMP phosphodiesterase CpdA
VDATMRDGFNAAQAAAEVRLKNGTTAPPPPAGSFKPHTVGKLGRPIVVAATGDGASGEAASAALTAQMKAANPDLFLYLGDVYSDGTYTEFYNWYGTPDRFFGQLRQITNPVVGNHEYVTANAYGYFRYWDNIPHYYSYGVGDWRFIALDSNSQFGQTGPTTAQFEWLERELSANPAQCTLVYVHHPRYSIGPQGDSRALDGMWRLMAAQGVDLVLAGHEHSYQRWQPLDGAGQPHPAGMTQFVVGTGGHGIQRFTRDDARVAAGLDTPGTSVGTLYLYLQAGRADYRFVNTAGAVLDQGSVTCSGEQPRTMYLPLIQR